MGRGVRDLVPHPGPTHQADLVRRPGGKSGALRAAIFGVNDGLVSNLSLLMGVAGASVTNKVILLAGVTSIPSEILESARLDGATGWTLVRHMTIPLIMPAITVNLLIGITGGLRLLELPLIMTKGGPRNASETVMMSPSRTMRSSSVLSFLSGPGKRNS